MRRTLLLLPLFLAFFLLGPSSAGAATLQVAGGKLVGALGVDVGGTLYDVSFVDGSCIALFAPCDPSSVYVFSGSTAGQAAAQALLDQVFLDGGLGTFDTDPELTAGCEIAFNVCSIHTPHTAFAGGNGVFASSTVNFSPTGSDFAAASGTIMGNNDLTGNGGNVWAVWAPASGAVPEPAVALLTAVGLLGLAISGRRR